MPVTMEAVQQVAHDAEHFSSIFVSVARLDAVRRPAPPITSDPPDHLGHRRLLLPSFSPKRIALMEEDLRRFCRALIDELDGATHADASEQYAQHPGPRHLPAARRPGVGRRRVPRLDLPELPARAA